MKIRLYQKSDRRAWDQYIMTHPAGTIFHLSGWKRVVEQSFGHKAHYLLAESSFSTATSKNPDSEAQILGVLPLFTIKSLFFVRSMVSLPFASCGGILANDDVVRKALYRKAVTFTKSTALDYLELRNENNPLPELPVKDLYYGFKKEIFADNDENLKAIPRKTRRMVRKGMNNSLEAVFGGAELLSQFYALFAFSYRGFGTPVFSKKHLNKILEEFGEKSNILIISKEGRPLTGVLSIYFKDKVVPYYSGAYPESRKYAANDYLYWVLMSNAADRGCRVFDFGRSKKDTGPFHFKRHWGFKPYPLRYQYYLNNIQEIPDTSPTNPKYKRPIEIWKRLPLWLTKLIGPRIVKYIP